MSNLDEGRFEDAFRAYIDSKRSETIKDKLQAQQCFKEKWNLKFSDFAAVLNDALEKVGKELLNPGAKGQIITFARQNGDEVKSMFENLFNEEEDKPYFTRAVEFEHKSDSLAGQYSSYGSYQDEFAVSAYLWLCYPEKYYSIPSKVEFAENKLNWKNEQDTEGLLDYFDFCSCICERLRNNQGYEESLKGYVGEDSLSDLQLHALASDMVSYVASDNYSPKSLYMPSEQDIEQFNSFGASLTKKDWLRLLSDKSIFTPESLEIMKRMKDFGGAASSQQLQNRYGGTKEFYDRGSDEIARKICQSGIWQGLDTLRKSGTFVHSPLWHIIYTSSQKDANGYPIWRLRDSLSEALDGEDLQSCQLYENNGPNYWWLSCDPKVFSLSNMSNESEMELPLYSGTGHPRRIFKNFLDARIGDQVIGYESESMDCVTSLLEIFDRNEEAIYLRKVKNLDCTISVTEFEACPNLKGMEYFSNPTGELFKLTREEYKTIDDIIYKENPADAYRPKLVPTSSDSGSKSEGIANPSPSELAVKIAKQLRLSRNLLLHGAPGTGKTYLAKQIASFIVSNDKTDNIGSLTSEEQDRIGFVQFYPGYDYSNFVEGYKPIKGSNGSLGFELKDGIFKKFVNKAQKDGKHNFVFIIDEINRGNISSIFGELFSALEPSERGRYKATLQYSGQEFYLPSNLYLIGTMNDIDRSAEPLDFAFRRRWDFREINPNDTAEEIIDDKSAMLRMEKLNERIRSIKCLGSKYQIGASYFRKLDALGSPSCLWEWELKPLLEEYLRGVRNGEEIIDQLYDAYDVKDLK